jgi:hypothetical protein
VAERSGESVGVSLSTITTDNARNVGGDEVKVIPREVTNLIRGSGRSVKAVNIEAYQDVDLVPLLPYPSTRGKTRQKRAIEAV